MAGADSGRWRAFSHFPVRQRRRTIVVALIVGVLATLAASRLRPTASLETMFAHDDDATRALARIHETLPNADELVVVVSTLDDARPPALAEEDLVAFAERLEQVVAASDRFAGAVASVRYRDERRAEADRFYEDVVVPHAMLYLSQRELEAVCARLTGPAIREQIARNETLMAAPGPAADAVARTVLRDPLRLYEDLRAHVPAAGARLDGSAGAPLLSQDGRSLLIRITGTRPVNDLDFARALVRHARAAVIEADPGHLVVGFTGAYAIAELSERSIRRDMIVSVMVAVALLCVVFLVAYRSLREFTMALGAVGLGILSGFGVFALLRTTLNPATAVIGAVLAGLGVDFAIHVMSRARAEQDSGAAPAAATATALDGVRGPVAIAALTSLIGFFAVSRSSVQALRDFGLLGVLGLAGALLASITVLPALMVTLPPVLRRAPRVSVPAHLVGVIAGRPWRWIGAMAALWAAALVVVVMAGGPPPSEKDWRVMHPQPNEPLALQGELARRFGEPAETILIWIEARPLHPLLETAWIVHDRLGGPSATGMGIDKALGIASLLPDPRAVEARLGRLRRVDVEQVVADFRAALDESVFDPAAYEDYQAFLRQLLTVRSAPGLDDLRAYPAIADGLLAGPREAPPEGAVVLVRLNEVNDHRRGLVVDWLGAQLEGLGGATVTGLTAISRRMDRTIRRDLARLLGLAGLVVAVFLLAVYRQPLDVLLVLLPTGFALTCLLAVMHLTEDTFNIVNVSGLPLLVGIGVDDGVFLVSLARRARREGTSGAVLVARYRAVCHAVLVTSATTILAFGSLLFASTPAIRSLGRLTVIGVAGCLVATLLTLLPILLLRHRHAHVAR